jgi:hypothetical protein
MRVVNKPEFLKLALVRGSKKGQLEQLTFFHFQDDDLGSIRFSNQLNATIMAAPNMNTPA